MARPTTKQELITAGNEQYKKMCELIDSMAEEEQKGEFKFDIETLGKEAHWKRDKNIRDVLIHLYEWHQLLINWVTSNKKGVEKSFLPDPYDWKTYGNMNVDFFERHQDTSYDKAREILNESHNKVMSIIGEFSNDELFIKKYFTWTGTTNLGSYCISSTSSHYDWAIKKVKKYIKQLK